MCKLLIYDLLKYIYSRMYGSVYSPVTLLKRIKLHNCVNSDWMNKFVKANVVYSFAQSKK